MEQHQQESIYEAESPEVVVSDLFSGKLPFKQALLNIRTRLLDLSSRNRLLNYKYPKGRSIQFVDNPNLNLVFTRLLDGKPLQIKSIPDPPTSSYAIRRPDVKIHAQSLDIVTDYDIPASARQSLSSIEQILSLEGTVTITKRGKEIARVIPIKRMISIPSHCNLREKTPRQVIGSDLLIRADRDER